MPISAGIFPVPNTEGPIVWLAQFRDTSDVPTAYTKISERFPAVIAGEMNESIRIEVTVNEDNIIRMKAGDVLIYFGGRIIHLQYGDDSGAPIMTTIDPGPVW